MGALEILSRHMLVDGYPLILDLQKSQGCRIVDKKTGKSFLDLFSFFASSPVGMNHPEMINKEFLDKLAYVAVNKPSCSDFYTDEMAEFVDTFDRIGIPGFLPNLFLISGGALAVENALKSSFDWKVRKNFVKGVEGELGTKVIHFQQSFHGRSGYTLSLTNTFDPRKTKYFPKFKDWPRVINPTMKFPVEEYLEQVISSEEQSISQIDEAIDKYGNDIAALLIEPIQGEGGDNHFRTEFMAKLRNIADKNEIMLIYDEIQTGVGLTGKFWCFEHFENAKPDIISFGKKMQVCGILASDRVKEVKNNVFEESSRINSTWGGNLVDMVRATKYLEIIEKENLIDKTAKNGEYMLNQLIEIQNDYPEKISNARGKGFMIAFDLQTTDLRDKIKQTAYDKSLLILASGVKSIRFRPPLNIQKNEIDEGLAILRDIIREI
ncbi:MAG: L-lysine 6-transaminase [Asgard group archaeon]|nr:L-lysine 6-transaminase [Asgard group archaeon]